MEQITKKRVIGVDISLEETTLAVVDVRGNILDKRSLSTEDYPEINNFAATLSDKIMELVEANGGYEAIRSVGISAPSGNFMTGCIENSANMPWKGVIPLAVMLRDRIGLAVALTNNAHVIALGESAFGCAHGMRDFIILSMGTGLGSCVFADGRVNLGHEGFAGEVGHTMLYHNGRQCGCGNKGCLEAYVAAKGIVLTAKEVMAESSKPSLMRSAEKLSPKIISHFCNEGDELAIEVFRRTGYYLGLGLANYASVFDPEAFIFTGGIPKAGKWLLDPALETFNSHVFHNIENKVQFLVSELDDRERDVLGASVLAWDVKEYSLFK